MRRKDYLLEELSKEEKLYLKKIVMTARNKYIQRNRMYLNSMRTLNDEIISTEESVLESILQKCQEEVTSAVEFEKTFSNPSLYNIVKALSLKEKHVLFYLYKEQKSVNEISHIMHMDRVTIWRIRDRAQKKIAEKLVKGEM